MVLFSGFLVFFMQIGFVSIEAGAGRAKNVRNILLKNMVNIMLCALCWWAVGYTFAYGDSAGGILGVSNFFTSASPSSSGRKPWFFTWTFALSTVTITSGCLAERTHLFAYPVYTTVTTMMVHPVVVHWVWNPHSWLQSKVGSGCQFLDFAGGSAVHLVGGLMGLVGAWRVGPRLGRFEDGGGGKGLQGHHVASYATGTLMLWFGWFGFNCGSTYTYLQASPELAPVAANRVALNMTLCASAAGLSALFLSSIRSGTFDLTMCCNGLLSGLGASTANAGFVQPWAAAAVGALAGAAYVCHHRLLVGAGIDDPLDSSAVHAGSGVLGCLSTAFLATPAYVKEMTGSQCGGIVYGRGAHGWTQLGMQLLGLVVTSVWVAIWGLAVFSALKALNLLRVDQQTELAGIDNMEHGGPAYPEFGASRVGSNTGQ